MKTFPIGETELFLPFRIGPTARETLQEFIDIDVRAEDLVRILNQNQAYRDYLFRFVNEKTGGRLLAGLEEDKDANIPPEQRTPTYRTVSLLGMLQTRNSIVALRMLRLANGCFPFSEDGKASLKAGEQLKWALEAEDTFQRNSFEYSETAYAAAALLDLAKVLSRRDEENHKRVEPYYKRTWTRALRTALIAYLLSQHVSGMNAKQALAAGFLVHAGKLALAAWLPEGSPTYAEQEEALDSNRALPQLARLHLERDAHGISHEEVSAHLLRYFDLFKPLIPAVRFYREPYCLTGTDQHSLALVLWLADSMARSWRVPAGEQDSVFEDWRYPGLKLLGFSRVALLEIMRKMLSLR